jgi:cytochrome bd-type quinol oxidase subunit 2
MGATPPKKTESKQRATAVRLLLVGAVLFAVGLVIVLLVDGGGGKAEGIGVAFMSLAAVPTLAALTLAVSAWVSRRSRQGKPFA